VAQYEDSYRLRYVRGPEGIIVALVSHGVVRRIARRAKTPVHLLGVAL